MQIAGGLYGIDLSISFLFLVLVGGKVLYKVPVVYGYKQASNFRIPAQVQVMLKSKHRQLFLFLIN